MEVRATAPALLCALALTGCGLTGGVREVPVPVTTLKPCPPAAPSKEYPAWPEVQTDTVREHVDVLDEGYRVHMQGRDLYFALIDEIAACIASLAEDSD